VSILENRHILLIIGGGIAAYKTPALIRALQSKGARVRCILTKGGSQFVTPLTLASLSGDKIYQNLFDLTDEIDMGHIQLSRAADLVLVAPATADLMSKMAQGLANDLASTTLLATDKPVMIAPAMNMYMWAHPATQRNMAVLQNDGIQLIGPMMGDMACGEEGLGRMSEPEEIVEAVSAFFAIQNKGGQNKGGQNKRAHVLPLAGRRALITAGPTREPIDPMRYITNHSSGKQGFAIAEEIAKLGAQTQLIAGPVQLADPENITTKRVETAHQMLAACEAALPCDIAIMNAAVADWRVAHPPNQKLKKAASPTPPELILAENPDILAQLGSHKKRPHLLIGFAAETECLLEEARAKRARKKCDWIIANQISPTNNIMGGDENKVFFLSDDAEEQWGKMSKQNVAAKLAARIANYFAMKDKQAENNQHH